MKKIVLSISIVGIFLLNGCQSSDLYKRSKSDLYKRSKSVNQLGNRYYYAPVPTKVWLSNLAPSTAKHYNKLSEGLMRCRGGDMIVTDSQSTHKELKSALSKNYKETILKLVKSNRMICVHPMSVSEVRQYKAEKKRRDRINNDPRVVAARIQANAIANSRIQANIIRNTNHVDPYAEFARNSAETLRSQQEWSYRQSVINTLNKPTNIYVVQPTYSSRPTFGGF